LNGLYWWKLRGFPPSTSLFRMIKVHVTLWCSKLLNCPSLINWCSPCSLNGCIWFVYIQRWRQATFCGWLITIHLPVFFYSPSGSVLLLIVTLMKTAWISVEF
jgi:hypothetical protein